MLIMNNLHNVIILSDNLENLSLIKYFNKCKIDKHSSLPKLPQLDKKYLPSPKKKLFNINNNISSPTQKFTFKSITSPTYNPIKKLHKKIFSPYVKMFSPTNIENKIHSPYKNQSLPILQPLRPKNDDLINNKNMFNFDVYNIFDSNDKMIRKNILSRDGIIIILEQINSNIYDILIRIINRNNYYNKQQPIMILFDTTKCQKKTNMKNKRKLNLYFQFAYNINELLKNQLTIKNKHFPIISIVKNFIPEVTCINIEDQYDDKNPIDIFIEQLQQNEIKMFNINEYNYQNKQLIREFESLNLPIRLWNHYGKLRLMHNYLLINEYKTLVSNMSILYVTWKKYINHIKQKFTWNYTLFAFWLNILQKLKLKYKYKYKYENFVDLCKKYTFITNEFYYKKFYSDELIQTEYAKEYIAQPDL
jgi:hypothetical protein